MGAKRTARRLLNRLGFDIVPFDADRRGFNPLNDIRALLKSNRPIVFDVGANVGQTVKQYRHVIPQAIIHSFEPSPSTFNELKRQVTGESDVHLWNYALGAEAGHLRLMENELSDMSSFLPLGDNGWGAIMKETDVEVRTVDQVCNEHGIDRIDLLKCDTQGYDIEVLRGAGESIQKEKIGLVFLEINLLELYVGAPTLSDVYDFMRAREFLLVAMYKFHYHGPVAAWTDALFVHRSYIAKASNTTDTA